MVEPSSATLLLLVAIVALVLPVAYWVIRPLIVGTLPEAPPDPKAVALLSEREAALASLRDLDADVRDERISADRHAVLRTVLVERGARVLEALDGLSELRAGESAALAAALEREVLALRKASESESESESSATAKPADSSSRACSHCGYVSQDDARFCGGCGEALEEGTA